jgi:hypothetical protein
MRSHASIRFLVESSTITGIESPSGGQPCAIRSVSAVVGRLSRRRPEAVAPVPTSGTWHVILVFPGER